MNYCESNEFLSLTCGVECFPYRYIVPFLLLISFFPTHLNLFLYRFKKRNHFNSVRALLSLVVWWLFFLINRCRRLSSSNICLLTHIYSFVCMKYSIRHIPSYYICPTVRESYGSLFKAWRRQHFDSKRVHVMSFFSKLHAGCCVREYTQLADQDS